MAWEHFQHGADIGVRGIGPTIDAAFADAAVLGFAFGWPPIEVLSRLTMGLLIHPLIVGGFAWLITKFLGRRKRSTG